MFAETCQANIYFVKKNDLTTCYFISAAMQANAMGINPQLNMANMVAMQGRNTNMFTQGSFTPSPTTVSLKWCIVAYFIYQHTAFA